MYLFLGTRLHKFMFQNLDVADNFFEVSFYFINGTKVELSHRLIFSIYADTWSIYDETQ